VIYLESRLVSLFGPYEDAVGDLTIELQAIRPGFLQIPSRNPPPAF